MILMYSILMYYYNGSKQALRAHLETWKWRVLRKWPVEPSSVHEFHVNQDY